MNDPRSKLSKHSDYFLITYGHCSNCAKSGKVAGAHVDKRRFSEFCCNYFGSVFGKEI